MPDISDRMRSLIADHLYVDIEKVTPEAYFIEDLGVDSLDVVDLMIAAEEEFGVSLDDDDVAKINRVADAVRLVEAA